ncbi:hypothetical protein KAS08_02070 [Candidatus Pacearchaeota archaeon]|nr:hypothetical protein [Candidatus Pacearchaeota archaeon]
MDDWQRRVLLEDIIYKIFRKVVLDDKEKKMIEEVVEMRDYGKILD